MNEEFDTEINAELFNNDLDDLAWEPEVIDDSDKESADLFGYK